MSSLTDALFSLNENQILIDSDEMKLLLNWVSDVLNYMCNFSEHQKIMIFATCKRIINSYINTFQVKKNLWQVIAISTIWLAIKAYCIDEEEQDEWFDAEYMASLCPGISKKHVIDFEILIFKYLNCEIISQEKEIFKNHFN